MHLYFRRLVSKISDYLEMPMRWSFTKDDLDFRIIMKNARKIMFMNCFDIPILKNFKAFRTPLTTVPVNIFIPTGQTIVGLYLAETKEWIAFPYVIISERAGDCRIVIFESVEKEIEWLRRIEQHESIDSVMKLMSDSVRSIRHIAEPNKPFFTGDIELQDMKCVTVFPDEEDLKEGSILSNWINVEVDLEPLLESDIKQFSFNIDKMKGYIKKC